MPSQLLLAKKSTCFTDGAKAFKAAGKCKFDARQVRWEQVSHQKSHQEGEKNCGGPQSGNADVGSHMAPCQKMHPSNLAKS